ncbi:hypothetical protein DW322_06940 [Rhodococcus rhodnii]|uniref:YcaO domain-containing protein n=1 Tax=Rhodococcus rhodnii TaxID=38312 RepID=A0A6P2CB74_9NOCA|nr:YcaO-like family protein [Rhodococcus rhodnii]TXG89997.1 hypothetical protein DW322_06940 [Rhodococcus rhodnii]
MGKGSSASARVGAVFEALEHYVSRSCSVPAETVKLASSSRVAKEALAGDLLADIVGEAPEGLMACAEYRAVAPAADYRGPIDVPLGLSSPSFVESADARQSLGDSFDYRPIARYCTSTGWAAGVTVEDALLHALNEQIERHLVSEFIADQFLSSKPQPINSVDRESVPESLRGKWIQSESVIGSRIHVIRCVGSVDYPTYIAYAPGVRLLDDRLRGAGSSISHEHAVERALSEIAQSKFAIESGSIARKGLEYSKKSVGEPGSKLRSASEFDLDSRIENVRSREFPDSIGYFIDTVEQVAAAASALLDGGLKSYYSVRFESQDLAIVNVFIPGVERFLLIRDGHLVVPSRKTISRL